MRTGCMEHGHVCRFLSIIYKGAWWTVKKLTDCDCEYSVGILVVERERRSRIESRWGERGAGP